MGSILTSYKILLGVILFQKAYFTRGLQDLIVTLFSRGGSMLIGLAMQSALAWVLGPEMRGEYAICLIFSTFAATFFTFGIDWAASYFSASKDKPLNEVAGFCSLYYLLLLAIMLPSLLLIIDTPIKFFEQASPQAFTLSIAWASAIVAYNISAGFLRGLRMFSILAAITLSKALLSLLTTLLLFHATDLDVQAPIWADLASTVIAICTMAIMLSKKQGLRLQKPSYHVMADLFSYGGRMFVGSIGMMTNLRIGTILVAFYLTKDEIGYFALAMALLTQVGTLADVVNNVTLPRIAESKCGRVDLVSKSARCVSTFVFILGILLIATAEWLIPILFSESFYPAIAILFILYPGMWLRSLCKVLFAYFNGINKPQLVSINMAVNIFFNIIFLTSFIPLWGLHGAAWAVTASNFLSSIFLVYYYFKLSGSNFQNIFLVTKKDFYKGGQLS
jgi:O-antigen/teichoic acid export membrane protein